MSYLKCTLSALAAATLSLAAEAQQPAREFGGAVLGHDTVWPTDLAQLTRPQAFATARVMALGGAFASLGADLSAMSINPAGLGMYIRNEISLTPYLGIAQGDTEGTTPWGDNGRSRFAMANFGAALNVYERGTGTLTSLTFGIGLNRVADFNQRYSFSSESRYTGQGLMPTIADVFAQQMNFVGILPDRAPGGDPNGSLGYMNPFIWPATLAYNGYVIGVGDFDDGHGGTYSEWLSNGFIGSNASVLHSMEVVGSGSINEVNISLGANLQNIVYIGASFGLQSVHKRTTVIYQEEYGYFDNPQGFATDRDGNPYDAQLNYMNLWQRSKLDGSGVNFKLGVIVRPTPGLRIGVALHTPTYYSLERSYDCNMRTELGENDLEHGTLNRNIVRTYNEPPEPSYNEGPDSWDFVSPTRLMAGISYTFGRTALLTVDYERDWYNGIRVKNVPAGNFYAPADYKTEFKRNFCGTSTLRAGLEVKPLPAVALRVGGGYTGSMLKDRSTYSTSARATLPVTYETTYYTAGAGFVLSKYVTLDVAYQYLREKMTSCQLFVSYDNTTGELLTASGLYDTRFTRHNIAATISFRF